MRIIKIKKRNGGERIIYAPNHREKARLRLMVPALNDRVLNECDPNIVHGFVPGKSPVTNALKHVGYQFTLSMDLKDFFGSVRPYHIGSVPLLTKHCFIYSKNNKIKNLAPQQGLPTSPAIANLAGIVLDTKIKSVTELHKCIYTRYADDLSISGNDINDLILIRNDMKRIVEECGFTLNDRKTRIQSSSFGRRNITGVMVDDKNIYPTRAIKRKLRAARHQGHNHHAKGLAEWCKLKTPNPNGSQRISKVQKAVARHAGRVLVGVKNVWL